MVSSALEEWRAVYNNKTKVKRTMSLIEGTTISDDYYWSSTKYFQYSTGDSFALDWDRGGMFRYDEYSTNYVRAFCLLS